MATLELLSDLILVAATLGLAVWCRVLAQRLKKMSDAKTGVGQELDALREDVVALRASLSEAKEDRDDRAEQLARARSDADDRIGRMEMLLASLEALEEETSERLLAEPNDANEPIPNFRATRPMAPAGDGR